MDKQQWTAEDYIRSEVDTYKNYSSRLKLDHGNTVQQDCLTPLEYFMNMFPCEEFKNIVKYTNLEIDRRVGEKLIDNDDILQWIGVKIAMVLDRPRGDIKQLWEDDDPYNCHLRPGYYLDKTGMSLSTFKEISSCIRFGPNSTFQVSVLPFRRTISRP